MRLARRRSRKTTEASAGWPLVASVTPYVTAEQRKALFLVPTHDRKAGLFLRNRRPRQFVRLARAVKILREAGRLPDGGVLVDVGAHIGTTTIMALREHGFSEAVAIESDLDNDDASRRRDPESGGRADPRPGRRPLGLALEKLLCARAGP